MHVSGGGGQPVTDAEVVELELQLADLAQIDRRRTRKTLSQAESAVLDKLHDALNSGLSARRAGLTETETQSIAHLGLLTLKPLIFAVNVAEDSLAAARRGQGGPMVDSIMEHAKVG